MTCTESAPRWDGIPYSVYKITWSIVGPYIYESWKQSCECVIMPPSHSESIIILIPKEGKDAGDITNWRPITLSNCDAKIITKALAIRMSGFLNEIIDIKL